ncbi:MAG: polymer-forming cytoskeletal protein [Pseudomonadota bacterium]
MFSKTSKNNSSNSTVNSNNVTVSNNQSVTKKGAPSVISNGSHILGNIVSDGILDIDGTLEGNVRAEQVNVRSNGRISGDIVAESVHIYGQVHGLVKSHAVHLYSTANMSGTIVHHSLTVEEGAIIDAKFKRVSENASRELSTGESSSEEGDGLIESAPSFVGAGTLRLIG